MKKNKILILSLLSLTMALSSCNDDDIFQDSQNSTNVDNFYKNETDFTRAILGAYNGFRGDGFFANSGFSYDLVIVGDLLSDNLILNPYGRRGNQISSFWGYDALSTPTPLYSSAYRVIANANLLLSKIDNLPEGNFKKQINAEALAIRAIAHLEVARSYAEIPTQNASSASTIGIAYIEKFDRLAQPSREGSIGEVYTKIIRDLEIAVEGVPNSVEGGPYRFTKNSIKGFLSRAYLYTGNYAKVIENASSVVSAVQPTAKEDLQGLWSTAHNKGVLFALPFSLTNDAAIGGNYSQGTTNGNIKIEYSVDKAFYDIFNQVTEPERLAASIKTFKYAADGGALTYAVNKYITARTGFGVGVNDGRYLRVEEVILNLAEAQYLSGNQASALTTLNLLRDARYSSYDGGEAGDVLFEAIITERRKELAFEIGDRFFTLKRLLGVPNIPAKYSQGIVRSGNGHRADGSGTPSNVQTLPASSHKWQFPIAQSILNNDKNMTQTPGY